MPATTPEGIPYLLPGDHPLEYPAQSQQLAAKIAAAAPPGSVQAYAGAAAPTGWLLCDGAAVSRTTYAALFAAIGVTYGVGDGTTTFNLPNLKGRAPFGLDAAQTEFTPIGKTGGAKTHAHGLTAAGAMVTIATGSPATLTVGRGTIPGWNATHSMPLGGVATADNNAQTLGAKLAGSTDAPTALPPYVTMPYIIKT